MNIKKTAALLLSAFIIVQTCSCGNPKQETPAVTSVVNENLPDTERYELEQVVVLSRHNIRSPLSGGDSLLGTITPHKWFDWSSDPSELSLRGGALETEMGQYFRKRLEEEGLFPKNYHPNENEVRIYANSKQRTIATARYFSAGLLPTANTQVEYHMEFDKMDPVFTPRFTFVSDEYASDVRAQINKMFSDRIAGLADNYKLITDVIDMKDSEKFRKGEITEFRTDDTEIVIENFSEPGMKGSLKTACGVSDALVLQYYEETDSEKAAFGHKLTANDWKKISEIKDLYGDVLFSAPLVSVNVAHPLLEEIRSELDTKGRKFTFLCGHDSNVGSVLAALEAEDYTLPFAIESKTPIGVKLVFCKWRSGDGKEYITAELVYQTCEQLRSLTLLDADTTPAIFALSFAGLEKNADGLYAYDDLIGRFDKAVGAYDDLKEKYGYTELPDAA